MLQMTKVYITIAFSNHNVSVEYEKMNHTNVYNSVNNEKGKQSDKILLLLHSLT